MNLDDCVGEDGMISGPDVLRCCLLDGKLEMLIKNLEEHLMAVDGTVLNLITHGNRVNDKGEVEISNARVKTFKNALQELEDQILVACKLLKIAESELADGAWAEENPP